MALDVHNLENNDFLFSLENFSDFNEIFQEFYYRTGILIDEYSDTKILTIHQKILIKIIEEYILKENLNKNKEKIKNILEFSGILKYFISKEIEFCLFGD